MLFTFVTYTKKTMKKQQQRKNIKSIIINNNIKVANFF